MCSSGTSPDWCTNAAPNVTRRNTFIFQEMSGSSTRNSGLFLATLESTSHCCKLLRSSVVNYPINEGRSQTGDGGGDSTPGDGVGGEGDGDWGLSAGGGTCTSKGILIGMGATTPSTSSCCPTSTSPSRISSQKSSWSILQYGKLQNTKIRPRALIPTPLFIDPLTSLITAALRLIDS